MTIAIATACWGSYWDQFGAEFISSIMKSPCDEVIIVADDIDAPKWVKHVKPVSDVPAWDWFNEAVSLSSCEWVLCQGVDDVLLPGCFDGLDLDGDVIAISGLENGILWHPNEHEYQDILSLPHNPMRGGTLFRRKVFLEFPWRRVKWPDWAQWLEFRDAGLDVRFDYHPRFIHRRHQHANSMNHSPQGDQEIMDLKRELLSSPPTTFPETPH